MFTRINGRVFVVNTVCADDNVCDTQDRFEQLDEISRACKAEKLKGFVAL